jgi:uncharacterized membrane protein YhhN
MSALQYHHRADLEYYKVVTSRLESRRRAILLRHDRRTSLCIALTFGRLRNFGRVDMGLLLLSIVSSVAYLAMRGSRPSSSVVVLKALSIAPLALLAFRVLRKTTPRPYGRKMAPHANVILAAALTLSCVGDVALAVDPRRYFGHALYAFLLAHLAYILLFVGSWPRPLHPTGRQLVSTLLVLVYGLLVTSWLAPGFGRLTVPAMVYAGAITAMAASTILAGFSRPVVLIGAILFMISDSLIAAARFKTGWSLAAYLIWPTYYLGQYGIAIGFLREAMGDDSEARPSL